MSGKNSLIQNVNVVFDTNAYRNLTHNLSEEDVKNVFKKIRILEESRGIRSLLSTVTLMELLTHLADLTDPGYEHCKLAVIGAYEHIREDDTFRIVPHPELQLQKMLFDEVDSERQEIELKLGGIAYQIHTGPADQIILQFNSEIEMVKKFVEEIEQYFIDDTLATITNIDPDAINWKLFQNDKTKRAEFLKYLRSDRVLTTLAGAFVIRVAKSLDKPTPTKEDYENMSAVVARIFKTALSLYLKVLERMTISGYNMTNRKKKRWNTIWDIYLLFSTTNETIEGKETIFVTDEEWLHEVCDEVGSSDKILKLSDYKTILGI